MASEEDKDNKISKLKLYSYWRSSCSFRVRIALNLKGLEYEYKAVNVLKGEQSHPDYLKLNPVGFVPVLVDGDLVLADSFAIIMHLDDKYPQHPLLPHDIHKKAINFQAAHIVSSSIQPIQNMRFLNYIGEKVGPDEKLPLVRSVIRKGFTALEKLLKDHTGRYATGDEVLLYNLNIIDSKVSDHKFLKINSISHRNKLLADLFLAPQLYLAFKSFNISMNEFPILSRLHETYNGIPAFQEALPENQPDAVQQLNQEFGSGKHLKIDHRNVTLY